MVARLISFVRPRATEESVQRPHQLARHVNDLGDALERIVTITNNFFRADPLIGGVLLKNVAVAAGVTFYFQHRLGRAYAGYFPTRLQGAAQTWKEMPLLSNMTSSDYLALQFSSSGTIDLYVF